MIRLDSVNRGNGSSRAIYPVEKMMKKLTALLCGLLAVAAQARRDGWQIEAVLNNDMIGNTRGINGVTDNTTARIFSEGTRRDETPEEALSRRFRGGEVDSPSRNLARYVDRIADQYLTNLDMMMVYRLSRTTRSFSMRPREYEDS